MALNKQHLTKPQRRALLSHKASMEQQLAKARRTKDQVCLDLYAACWVAGIARCKQLLGVAKLCSHYRKAAPLDWQRQYCARQDIDCPTGTGPDCMY
jgi:hypothetical protein